MQKENIYTAFQEAQQSEKGKEEERKPF